MWLEGNGLSKLEGLECLTELRGLYCQQNCIKTIEGLDTLKHLDTLNLSNNLISKIEGLEGTTELTTANFTHNRLTSADDVRGLLDCSSLRVLDLSHNKIDDPEILSVFSSMPDLRVLVLTGNPVIKKITQYRKTLIVQNPNLHYLDDRPVFPKERACAVAFMEGGREAERAARQAFIDSERERQSAGIKHLQDIQAQASQERETTRGKPDDIGEGDETERNWELLASKQTAAKGLDRGNPTYADQRHGKLHSNNNWEPTPDLETIDLITGPKAADINLFDSEDEYDELDEEPNTFESPSIPLQPKTKIMIEELPTPSLRTRMRIEEVTDLEPEIHGSEPETRLTPASTRIIEVDDIDGVDDEIPEEIIVPTNKHRWESLPESDVPDLEEVDIATGAVIQPQAQSERVKKLIEVVGDTTMDGLD